MLATQSKYLKPSRPSYGQRHSPDREISYYCWPNRSLICLSQSSTGSIPRLEFMKRGAPNYKGIYETGIMGLQKRWWNRFSTKNTENTPREIPGRTTRNHCNNSMDHPETNGRNRRATNIWYQLVERRFELMSREYSIWKISRYHTRGQEADETEELHEGPFQDFEEAANLRDQIKRLRKKLSGHIWLKIFGKSPNPFWLHFEKKHLI